MFERVDVAILGCSPVPMAHYLKALGILRTIVEDRDDGDPEARGYWQEDVFHIISRFEKESLLRYFLECYKPTPIVSPWNGRGGFLEGEEDDDPSRMGARMIQSFGSTSAPRFSKYKDVIAIININSTVKELNILRALRKKLDAEKKKLEKRRRGLNDEESKALEKITEELGIKSKEEKLLKARLIQSLRATIPENALLWMDACLVLAGGLGENASMPPLLGSGGVDGSQDFSVNFMQQLSLSININNGMPREAAKNLLTSALFQDPVDGLSKSTVGQFFPSAVGGANAISGFESGSLMNPWDYILMIEGTLLFAAASVRQLGTDGPSMGAFPFTVNTSAVGYGSASDTDEKSSRSAEMWVPLWDKPTGLRELSILMGEGRAQIRDRAARNGVDFIRAVACLGVDRGINEFQRYGFLERNGRAYFAVPLDKVPVNRQSQVDLLSDVDSWLSLFSAKAKSKKASASAGRALRTLETSIFSLCKERETSRVQDVLMSLGECEKFTAKSFKWAKESFVRPIPALSERWLREADDGSPEFRLAASLASVYGYYSDDEGKPMVMPIRSQMEPVRTWLKDGHLGVAFDEDQSKDVIWSDGDPLSAMNRIMARRIMRAVQSGSRLYPDHGWVNSDLGDITDFIEGRIDLRHMVDLLWGLILVDWPSISADAIIERRISDSISPGARYGILKLCFAGETVRGVEIPIVPEIHRRAAAGDSSNAVRLAEHRLRGSGLSTAIRAIKISSKLTERMAAALLFPIGRYQIDALANKVLRHDEEKPENNMMIGIRSD
jgi:CRISPR-associated protein Csx17